MTPLENALTVLALSFCGFLWVVTGLFVWTVVRVMRDTEIK